MSATLAHGLRQLGMSLGHVLTVGRKGSSAYEVHRTEGAYQVRLFDTPDGTWVRLDQVRKMPYDGLVYNLKVPWDSSFLGRGRARFARPPTSAVIRDAHERRSTKATG